MKQSLKSWTRIIYIYLPYYNEEAPPRHTELHCRTICELFRHKQWDGDRDQVEKKHGGCSKELDGILSQTVYLWLCLKKSKQWEKKTEEENRKPFLILPAFGGAWIKLLLPVLQARKNRTHFHRVFTKTTATRTKTNTTKSTFAQSKRCTHKMNAIYLTDRSFRWPTIALY